MPITPLHIGPGLVVKAAGGSTVSLTVFAITQVAMDLEVAFRFAFDAGRLHGFTNSLLGASLVFVLCAFAGKPIGEWCLRWWNRQLSPAQAVWLGCGTNIRWLASFTGAAFGAYTHLVLDAFMHADAEPWAPLVKGNPIVQWMTLEEINLFCFAAMGLGAALLVGRYGVRRLRQIRSSNS